MKHPQTKMQLSVRKFRTYVCIFKVLPSQVKNGKFLGNGENLFAKPHENGNSVFGKKPL